MVFLFALTFVTLIVSTILLYNNLRNKREIKRLKDKLKLYVEHETKNDESV